MCDAAPFHGSADVLGVEQQDVAIFDGDSSPPLVSQAVLQRVGDARLQECADQSTGWSPLGDVPGSACLVDMRGCWRLEDYRRVEGLAGHEPRTDEGSDITSPTDQAIESCTVSCNSKAWPLLRRSSSGAEETREEGQLLACGVAPRGTSDSLRAKGADSEMGTLEGISHTGSRSPSTGRERLLSEVLRGSSSSIENAAEQVAVDMTRDACSAEPTGLSRQQQAGAVKDARVVVDSACGCV